MELSIWSSSPIFIVKFLTPAVLHLPLFHPPITSRSNCDNETLPSHFFPPPTLWSLSLNTACPPPLFFPRKETIARNDAEHSARRLGGMAFSCSSQQSCRFLTVHNNSVFILHLKVTSDTGSNFPSCLKGEQKKKKTLKCVPDLVGDRQLSVSGLFSPFGGEKTIENDKKGDVLYLNMYIKWCGLGWPPGGQPRVPTETRYGCRTRKTPHPPPQPHLHPPATLSGGSVMALSFPRHVPGSFDTGNMHAGWQRPGLCGRDNDVHIIPPPPPDWLKTVICAGPSLWLHTSRRAKQGLGAATGHWTRPGLSALKSDWSPAFKVSSILLPFTLLLRVSDRMHLRDGGQTQGCLKMTREAETPAGAQGHTVLISRRSRGKNI